MEKRAECLWRSQTDFAIPYVGGSSLRSIETTVATADQDDLISVKMGVSFTLEDCLRFPKLTSCTNSRPP